MSDSSMQEVYARRQRRDWRSMLYRALQPPAPFVHNPAEPLDIPLGRWNLYVGGGGRRPGGYVNMDLFVLPGVDVVGDAELLPFPAGLFKCIECDAVLEHVQDPAQVMSGLSRVMAPEGHLHIVTPFCHPFHEYPRDYRRFTLDGLRQLTGSDWEVISEGWRTGPTATVLIFVLEFVKLWFPWKTWRILAHCVLGWLLFPFRYLDLLFFRSARAGIIGTVISG